MGSIQYALLIAVASLLAGAMAHYVVPYLDQIATVAKVMAP